jgi:hypothetical protein
MSKPLPGGCVSRLRDSREGMYRVSKGLPGVLLLYPDSCQGEGYHRAEGEDSPFPSALHPGANGGTES